MYKHIYLKTLKNQSYTTFTGKKCEKSNPVFTWFSRKNQVWRKCNFPKFGLSRNIQWGLRQIPSLAHLYSQDWKKKEIAISRRGLIKNTTLDSKLSRTGYYFHFPGLANKKSIQGLISSPYLENDISILGFLRSPL